MPKIKINRELQTTFSECVEKFINVQLIKNLSNHSIVYYKQALSRFEKATEILYIRDFNREMIEKYIADELRSGKIHKTSLNTYLRGVRVFARFLFERNIVERFEITLLKEDEVIKEPYTDEECRKLTAVPMSDNWVEHRMWAASSFLLATGVRLNTLTNIKIKDLDFAGKKFFVSTAKNRSQCFLPLSNAIIDVLSAYLGLYTHQDDDYLFPTQTNLKMANKSFEQAFGIYCKKRGVRCFGVHRLRHTFCSNLCKQNGGTLSG